jgi:predicted nucleotidyltransferase component of viral defense system
MKYDSASAFRMALEERLRTESLTTGVTLSRLRKTVAFDRLLARLLEGEPEAWVLKGGLALQLRLQDRARTTKDIDLHTREQAAAALDLLISSALIDLGDYFRFEVARPTITGAPLRCTVRSTLAGRAFESFHIDLGCDEERVGSVARLRVTSLLEFADIPAVEFPCLPLEQHLAEKVHALVRSRGERDNSRVKDLVDIVLIAETSHVDPAELSAALVATFAADPSFGIPLGLPEPPHAWGPQYRALAKDLGLRAAALDDGIAVARVLIDPALQQVVL